MIFQGFAKLAKMLTTIKTSKHADYTSCKDKPCLLHDVGAITATMKTRAFLAPKLI